MTYAAPVWAQHFFTTQMDIAELAQALTALGCPAAKAPQMAAQLDKRARQLADQKGRSYEEALTHLLELMAQGWAAKDRGNLGADPST